MAKIEGPLFSQEASGSMGPRLTFSQRKTGQQVRFQKKQKDHNTASQTVQRGFFEEGYAAWNTLSDAEKQQWNDFIKEA